MAGNFLVDTNVIVAFNVGEADVVRRVGLETVFLSVVVLGELYYGAFNSSRRDENLRKLEDLSARFKALTVDAETARWYGTVKEGLKRRGRPIPENDIWIAATTIQHDLVLATRDAHFNEVDGLKMEQR